MQQFVFLKNCIVPVALQNKDKQPKRNTVCNSMKSRHIQGKILANVTGTSISWKFPKLKIDEFNF